MQSSWSKTGLSSNAYDAKFAALERSGQDVHGEANFVASLRVSSILDAGCGTGRVAIELSQRGFEVVGVDRDADLLHTARAKAPHLPWYLEDLATVELTISGAPGQRRLFDAIIMAGNVMIFLDPESEGAVVNNMARHLAPGGVLVAGFQLQPGGFGLDQYDSLATRAGLELATRWATWGRQAWYHSSNYAVSVHRRQPA